MLFDRFQCDFSPKGVPQLRNRRRSLQWLFLYNNGEYISPTRNFSTSKAQKEERKSPSRLIWFLAMLRQRQDQGLVVQGAGKNSNITK